MTRLMKGTGRGGLQANDIGLIFATTHRATAEKYAGWRDGGEIVSFEADTSGVADLNNPEIAARIIDRIAETDAYYADNRDALIDELVNSSEDELGIIDDGNFRQAIYDCGYTGATQDGHYAFFDGMVEIKA